MIIRQLIDRVVNRVRAWADAHLLPDWKTAHRYWSIRLAAIGAALKGFALAFPGYATQAWDALPQDMRSGLPGAVLKALPAILFVMVILARVTKQQGQSNG